MNGWEAEIERVEGRVNVLDATLKQHMTEEDRRWEGNAKTKETVFGKLTELDRALTTRLPIWATFLIGGLMSLATWGLTK